MAPPTEPQKRLMAACKSDWVVKCSKVFKQLCDWQGGMEEGHEGPPYLYTSTLWSMLIAMGEQNTALTPWTAFFDEDNSEGTISV